MNHHRVKLWWRVVLGSGVLYAAGMARGQGTAGPGLLPVPGVALQGPAQELIHKLYQKDFAKSAAADRRALAKLLLTQGRETQDDAAARYVALMDAADLAAGAGDAATALGAIAEVAHFYSVNALDLRRTALVRAYAAAESAAESETVVRLALQTADEAAAADAFEIVGDLIKVAEAAANKTGQVKVVASIQGRLGELRDLVAEFGRVKKAFDQLAKDPNAADAHLLIGQFYALHKGQWALGLRHLAAGSDAELRALAAKELAHPTDGLGQAALGDGWWEYAAKSSGVARAIVTAHAVEWYKAAEQSLRGITLARIASRIENGAAGERPANGGAAPAGAAIDLLALIDTGKDAAQGGWSRGGGGLACDSSAYACLRLPFVPPEEYDLRVGFTRVGGGGAVAFFLVGQKHAFDLALDVKGEARFERVENRVAKDNPTTVPVAISNNRRYVATLEVRKDHVRALLDGKLLAEWKTDYKDMSRYAVWKLGDNTLCGVGANNAKVVFERIELVEVTGKGRGTR